MLKFSIDILSLRWNRRGYGLQIVKIILLLRALIKPKSNPVSIDLEQLRKINQLPISKTENILTETRALFVVTNKDFHTLPMAITCLLKNTGLKANQIDIVTPEIYLDECARLLMFNNLIEAKLIGESSLLPISELTNLKVRAGERFGWIYQQLLKLEIALNSQAAFTLVCDADTLLLRSRSWHREGKAALLPSSELNSEYYHFLNNAFGLNASPEYSFVSHHMLINRDQLQLIFNRFGLASINDLAAKISELANFENSSMVSVDYEMYAQSMYELYPEQFFLEKWSNIGISARFFKLFKSSELFRRFLSFNYQSVSFHSWS